jgi:hypothetical protein
MLVTFSYWLCVPEPRQFDLLMPEGAGRHCVGTQRVYRVLKLMEILSWGCCAYERATTRWLVDKMESRGRECDREVRGACAKFMRLVFGEDVLLRRGQLPRVELCAWGLKKLFSCD